MAEQETITLAIIAYRQENYIRAAIEGAFAQTCDNLEILLSDDGSPDSTFQIMQEMAAAYDGPHRIRLNRNEPNMGLIGHVNRIFELAEGRLVVMNAGDDISEPTRCAVMQEVFARTNAVLIHSDLRTMTPDGQVSGHVHGRGNMADEVSTIHAANSGFRSVIGASCAWSKELFQIFGPITEPYAYEDQVLYSRAVAAGRVEHVAEPLVRYRKGGMSQQLVGIEGERRLAQVRLATMRQRVKDFKAFSTIMMDSMRKKVRKLKRMEINLANQIEQIASGTAARFPEMIEGERLRLRLVTPDDAEYLFSLRTNPVYNAHLSPVIGTAADQRAWIERYKTREAAGTEAYYIAERLDYGRRCGTVRLYDINDNSFTWGSFILDGNKPPKAALEVALMSFAVGFDNCDLPTALVDVRIANQHAAEFYQRLGMTELRRDDQDIYLSYDRDTYRETHEELWDVIRQA